MGLPAVAEPPMNVDDAGTLDPGGMKIEGAWRKDDKTRGPELVFGFSPMENVEIGLAMTRDRDHGVSLATRRMEPASVSSGCPSGTRRGGLSAPPWISAGPGCGIA